MFISVRVCTLQFYTGLIYAWQPALGFFFLFNLWLDGVGTCFPVKPEKERLLRASGFAFVFLAYIELHQETQQLLAAPECSCVCLILSDGALSCTSVQWPPHWPLPAGWFRMLLRAAGLAESFIFHNSWETCPSHLFVCTYDFLKKESLWCLWDFPLDDFMLDNSPKSLIPSDSNP